MLGPLAQRQSVTLLSEIAPGCNVRADRQRLSQVVMNLGSNAIKYSAPGGLVRFTVETPMQRFLYGMREGRLAGAREPGEPDDDALVSVESFALFASDRGGVPDDIVRVLHAALVGKVYAATVGFPGKWWRVSARVLS